MKTKKQGTASTSLGLRAPASGTGTLMAFFLAVALLFTAGSAWAKKGAGGFTGPGSDVVITTVGQAKTLPDDSKVVLRGHIVQSLGGKDYLFKDDSGSIIVEIGAKRWDGQEVGPADKVEIHGEVDRDDADVEIDVKRIIKQ